MTLKYIRLPDGRTVNARSDRQLLLDVLQAILTGQMRVHISDIKTIAQWTFKENGGDRVSPGRHAAGQ